jgi:nitrous oxidase accessory protein
MLRPRLSLIFALAAPFVIGVAAPAASVRAEVVEVGHGESAADALSRAKPGDTLRLSPGVHHGDLAIGIPRLTIEGEPGAVLEGGGTGNAVSIKAADVTIRGLTIRGSGLSLIDKNSGVFVDRGGDRVRIENNALEDNLIAVYLDGPHDAVVRGNRILGLRHLRVSERGPAVSVWNTPGSAIEDNDIRSGRDGVFSVTSRHNIVRGNRFHDLRFAVHFMYTNDSEVADNLSEGNNAGYVMMYSDRLRLRDNVSDADRDHGLLFNYARGRTLQPHFRAVERPHQLALAFGVGRERDGDGSERPLQRFRPHAGRGDRAGRAVIGRDRALRPPGRDAHGSAVLGPVVRVPVGQLGGFARKEVDPRRSSVRRHIWRRVENTLAYASQTRQ